MSFLRHTCGRSQEACGAGAVARPCVRACVQFIFKHTSAPAIESVRTHRLRDCFLLHPASLGQGTPTKKNDQPSRQNRDARMHDATPLPYKRRSLHLAAPHSSGGAQTARRTRHPCPPSVDGSPNGDCRTPPEKFYRLCSPSNCAIQSRRAGQSHSTALPSSADIRAQKTQRTLAVTPAFGSQPHKIG